MARASVVTYKQVIAMREERANGGWTVKQLAARYGVHELTITRITTGITYKDLPGPISPKMSNTLQKECWRGHKITHVRRKDRGWRDCRECHRIRNRAYWDRKKQQRQQQRQVMAS